MHICTSSAQAIIWTNAGILLIWTLGSNLSEISMEIHISSFKKMNLKTSYIICKMAAILSWLQCVNTLRPRQNGRYFPDDIFKCIFLKENVWIRIKISLKFVPKSPINNIPALVQIMAWRQRIYGSLGLNELRDVLTKYLTHTLKMCIIFSCENLRARIFKSS